MKNKENLFSKKNYDVQLEALLDNKNYTDEAKSLILNSLYKIENAYKDYQKIKQDVKTKDEIVKDIMDAVKNKCDKIDILEPTDTRKIFVVDKINKIIKTFPHETQLLQALYYIKTPYSKTVENIFEKAVLTVLERGMAINGVEIIRDFNGWSWNNSLEDNESKYYNLIFQNLISLIGVRQLEEIIQGNNLIENLSKKIQSVYGEKKAENVISKLIKSCMLIYMNNGKKYQQEVDEYFEKRKKELYEISNKSKYVSTITKQNSNDMKRIGEINFILSSKTLLDKMYSKREISEKYGDIDTYKIHLIKYKNKFMNRINKNKKLINPFQYVKTKEGIENDVKVLSDIKVRYKSENSIYTSLIELQKKVMDCMNKKIEVYDLKKELLSLVYEIRYYSYIPLEGKKIKNIKNLEVDLSDIKKKLIEKLCNNKVVDKFSNNIDLNYRILEYICMAKMVDLNKILIKLEFNDKKLTMEYYDDNNIEYKTTINVDQDDYNSLTKKVGKKIRIFV